MNLAQYLAASPLPPGTLKFGLPAPANDGVNFCTYGLATEVVNGPGGLASAVAAIGITSGLPAGLSAPRVSDGTAPGAAFSGYTLANPPSTPPLPTDVSAWIYSGYFTLAKDTIVQEAVPGGEGILPAGTLCCVYENIGFDWARQDVTPQLAFQYDRNVVQVGTDPATAHMVTVVTSFAFVLSPGDNGGVQAIAYCVAPGA